MHDDDDEAFKRRRDGRGRHRQLAGGRSHGNRYHHAVEEVGESRSDVELLLLLLLLR